MVAILGIISAKYECRLIALKAIQMPKTALGRRTSNRLSLSGIRDTVRPQTWSGVRDNGTNFDGVGVL
jgi:hypothetical protein